MHFFLIGCVNEPSPKLNKTIKTKNMVEPSLKVHSRGWQQWIHFMFVYSCSNKIKYNCTWKNVPSSQLTCLEPFFIFYSLLHFNIPFPRQYCCPDKLFYRNHNKGISVQCMSRRDFTELQYGASSCNTAIHYSSTKVIQSYSTVFCILLS